MIILWECVTKHEKTLRRNNCQLGSSSKHQEAMCWPVRHTSLGNAITSTPTSSRGELVMRSRTASQRRIEPHRWYHNVWRDLQNKKAIMKYPSLVRTVSVGQG